MTIRTLTEEEQGLIRTALETEYNADDHCTDPKRDERIEILSALVRENQLCVIEQ